MKLLRNLSFGLVVLLIVILAVATCLEKVQGTPFVAAHVYGSPWFVALWAVLAVVGLCYLSRRRLRASVWLLHGAFVLILSGALATHLFGLQGSIHLRQGASEDGSVFTDTDGAEHALPFGMRLEEFALEYYPGTVAPMDFVSTFTITDKERVCEGRVSMNHIFRYRHYRFYQSGYDTDRQGTTLSVSYDPWGIGLTYAGYVLLAVSFLLYFLDRQSAFRRLLRHPLLKKATTAAALFAACTFQAQAADMPRTLPRETAESFGHLYIYYNDRICPLQTVAKDFTVKLTGKSSYKGLTPEQVLTGWFFYYDSWKEEPCIRIKNRTVQRLLGIDGKTARLADFAGIEGYKLNADRLSALEGKDKRAAEEANEKFSLVSGVATGSLWRIYPFRMQADTLGRGDRLAWYSLADRLPSTMSHEWSVFVRGSMNYVAEQVARKDFSAVDTLLLKIRRYQEREMGDTAPSAFRMQSERLYNRLNNSLPLAIASVMVGLLSFGYYCRRLMQGKAAGKWTDVSLLALLAVGLLYLAGLMALRGFVSGHVPLSNGHETMQGLAVCALSLTLCLHRRMPMALPFGYLVCGLALMVSMMGESNPQVTSLLPVLASPLLSVHVAVIMIAYALLAFVMLNGVAALVLMSSHRDCRTEVERLQIVSQLMLYPAVFLLAIGIFIGAVWANVSWGRYWGWDPKEVWALITMLVYALMLHPASLSAFRRPVFFHAYAVGAFLCVLVTYFGVNFLLGGLHGYA